MTVRTKQHEVLDLGVTTLLCSVDDVVKLCLALVRHFQANSERLSRGSATIRFFSWQIAIRIMTQISLSLGTFSDVLLDVFVVALFFRREVAIRLAFFDESVGGRSMLRRIGRLKHKVFGVVESEPLETFDDRARRLLGRALQIGVFDAEQELAAGLPREKPVEKRGTGGANMQVTGG